MLGILHKPISVPIVYCLLSVLCVLIIFKRWYLLFVNLYNNSYFSMQLTRNMSTSCNTYFTFAYLLQGWVHGMDNTLKTILFLICKRLKGLKMGLCASINDLFLEITKTWENCKNLCLLYHVPFTEVINGCSTASDW